MLDNIKKLLNNIMEDFYYDKEVRKSGFELFNEIRSELIYKRILPPNYYTASSQGYIYVGTKKKDNLGNELTIKLVPTRQSSLSGRYASAQYTNSTIILYIENQKSIPDELNSESRDLVSREVMNYFEKTRTQLADLRNSFVHEYIHFTDELRANSKYGWDKSYRQYGTKDKKGNDINYTKYYNQPIEYNAHVQGLFQSIDDMFMEFPYAGRMAFTDNVKDFIDFMSYKSPADIKRLWNRSLEVLKEGGELNRFYKKLAQYVEGKHTEFENNLKNEAYFKKQFGELDRYKSEDFKRGITAYGSSEEALVRFLWTPTSDVYLVRALIMKDSRYYNEARAIEALNIVLRKFPDIEELIKENW